MNNRLAIEISKIKAFTLIEILLLIAVLALIGSLSISSFYAQSNTQKADKMALQMQGILQAATAYYMTNGHWPANTGTTDQISSDFLAYLPIAQLTNNGQIMNPWGYSYSINGTNQTGSQTWFSVQTQAPNMNIAKRVAALLPYGSVANSNTVTALVPPPGANQNLIIQAIGTTGALNNGDSFEFPDQAFSCPPGWQPQAKVMLNFINAGQTPSSLIPLCNYAIADNQIALLSPNNTACYNSGSGYKCKIIPTATSRRIKPLTCQTAPLYAFDTVNYGKAAFTYIAFCVNPEAAL